MRELEIVVKGSNIPIHSFDEFVRHCRQNKPLVAIQLPEEAKFIAFIVKRIDEVAKGVYKPVTAGKVYDCDLPNGFMSEHGECSLPLNHYPVDITQQTFEQGEVFVLDTNSVVGAYIKRFMDAGRIKARELIREKQSR